jgi:CDP-paratose 2-epimerase
MKAIITGGAGFIGSNAASRYLGRGDEIVIIDDLSRPGSEKNLSWLRRQGSFRFENLDVRDAVRVRRVFETHRDAGVVLHLAGQVAVTASIANPRADFEANALGTLNVLEAMRLSGNFAPFLYSSTNKVYGAMDDLEVLDLGGEYAYVDSPYGVDENRPLDFHSPYGCSKGAGEQYVRDYHRMYGLQTVVFRQSCIYGPRQLGGPDQGWMAWFTIAAQSGAPITICGDGRQVRDVLYIDDLLDAYDAARERIEKAAGRIYNIGGGPGNAVSLLELLGALERRCGRPLLSRWDDWRPGDQKIYVSDTRRARSELGWRPRVRWQSGLELLYRWISENFCHFPRNEFSEGALSARSWVREAGSVEALSSQARS